MRIKLPLALRLSTGPAVAALAMVFLSALTIFDLSQGHRRKESEQEVAKARIQEPPPTKRVPLTDDVPFLAESDALKILNEAPNRAAVARLWPLEKHREALFKLLLTKDTSLEIRLYLLGRFEESSALKALEAARLILKEPDIPECTLLFSALEVTSRNGEMKDLALFNERPGESHQLKTLREEYRDELRERGH